jgi:hypothetical protein
MFARRTFGYGDVFDTAFEVHMQHRNVIERRGDGSIGIVSLIAAFVVAALIALFIWQPWDTTTAYHTFTPTSRLSGPGVSH